MLVEDIRVNAVSPGPIKTPIIGRRADEKAVRQTWDYLASVIPMNRMGEAEEVAKADYTSANGLPQNRVNAFLQTRAGEYWAATPAGVARFEPEAPRARKFTVFAPEDPGARSVNVIYEDRTGQLWGGSQNGLWQMIPIDAGRGQWRFAPIVLVTLWA
jgi:ligand-binding sensor domain-containing protein